jgi:putative transposase
MDNSMVETVFKSTHLGKYEYSPAGRGKAELIWRNRWETRRQAEGAIFQYINGFNHPLVARRQKPLGI